MKLRQSKSGGKQLQLTELDGAPLPEQAAFQKDLLAAFLKEGIPLQKLEKGPLRDVLDKYCGSYKVPSVSTLRRMVPTLQEEVSIP